MSQLTENKIELGAFLSSFGELNESLLGHELWDKQKAEAFEKLQGSDLPSTKDEEYKYYNITKKLNASFSTYAKSEEVKLSADDVKHVFFEGLEANVLVFVNGHFSEELSSIKTSKDILTVQSLKEAIANGDETLNEILLSEAKNQNDAFFSLNKAFASEGVYVKLAKNKACDLPLVFHYISDCRNDNVVYQPKNLFSVGKSSELSVIESFHTLGAEPNFTNIANSFKLEENANLNYYKIENDSQQAYHHSSVRIFQERNSVATAYTLSLDGAMIRNNLQFDIDGEGVTSNMYGLSLLKGNTVVDHHTIADHKFPNCESNELYKGVFDGKSKGVFNGKIFVRQAAQKTNAFQSNKNILMSDTARVDTKPQLEIWADDVKCSHGCTNGQLDEEQIFYLRSRGIGETDARAMLLYAFASDVTDGIAIPELKTSVKKILMDRLLD